MALISYLTATCQVKKEAKLRRKEQVEQQVRDDAQLVIKQVHSLTLQVISYRQEVPNKHQNSLLTVMVGDISKGLNGLIKLSKHQNQDILTNLRIYRQAVTGRNLDEPRDTDDIIKAHEALIDDLEKIKAFDTR